MHLYDINGCKGIKDNKQLVFILLIRIISWSNGIVQHTISHEEKLQYYQMII